MDGREGVLLDLVDESEWELTIRVDEEGDVELDLASHTFGGWTTTFVPPGQADEDGVGRNIWWIAQERLDRDGVAVEYYEGEFAVAEVVDKVPSRFESWVLLVTEIRADRLEAAEEFDAEDGAAEEVRDGRLLRAQLEQAKAHAETWRARSERRYGDVYLYELRDGAPLRWERGQLDGSPALLVWQAEDDGGEARAYVAPDLLHGWRWTSERYLDVAGEYLPVHEVLARVPEDQRGWVRRLTDEAYGTAVEEIARVSARACVSDRPEDFAELARLGSHAEALAIGRDAEPFTPGH